MKGKFIFLFAVMSFVSLMVKSQTAWFHPNGKVDNLTRVGIAALSNDYDSLENMRDGQLPKEFAPMRQIPMAKSPAPTAIVSEENWRWWRYSTGNRLTGTRNNSSDDYNVAIRIPASFAGAPIDSVAFILYNPNNVSNLRVWFSECKYDEKGNVEMPPADVDATDYSFDVESPTRNQLYYTVAGLPDQYVVPENGCFIGYAFTEPAIDKNEAPLILLTDSTGKDITQDGSYYLCYMTGKPKFYNMYKRYNYNLTTSIHVDMSNIVQSDVSPYAIVEATGRVGETLSMTAAVHNNSLLGINNFSYRVYQNGKASAEQTYELSSTLTAGGYATFSFNIAPEKEGVNNVSIEITKADGKSNTAEVYTLGGGVLVGLSETAERTNVVEEITGAWCGWCPRGKIGLDNLKKKYGDKIVTLAAHVSPSTSSPDSMATSDYNYVQYVVTGTVGSAPIAIFDRITYADPYAGWSGPDSDGIARFHADNVVEQINTYFPSEAALTLQAGWADDTHTKVTATVGTTFKYDRESYPYGLVFVLTHNGMFGMGAGWSQYNYYSTEYATLYEKQSGKALSHKYHDADMESYVNAGYKIDDEEYDNVIIGTWYNTTIQSGAYGALYGMTDAYANISNAKNKPLQWTTQLDFNDRTKKMVQDDTQLSMAVLLVNNNTGMVVNAAQVKISDNSGIESIASSRKATPAACFTLNGQRVTSPVKGVNIQRMTDGTTRKIIIR